MRDPWDGDTIELRRALPWIAGIIIAIVALAAARPSYLTTIGFVTAIIVMIMLHELGHFVVAKRAGMKVSEFFVGFGPRLWSVRRGETEYGIKAIPAGGYVRILGMNNLEAVDPADEERTYRSKPFRQRFAVAIAGSTMHFLLAFLLLFLALGPVGLPTDRPELTVVGQVEKSMPAAKAGFRDGDRVVAINGVPTHRWRDVPKTVSKSEGKTLVFTLERNGRRFDVPVQPKEETFAGRTGVFIGVRAKEYIKHEAAGPAVLHAGRGVVTGIGTAAGALTHLFSPTGMRGYFDNVTGRRTDENRPESVIGITRQANQARSAGELVFLLFILNMFVGVFNLIPLMPLDGGLVAVALYEKVASMIRRRRVQVDVAKLLPITATVFMLLVLLGLSALYLDVVHPLKPL